MSTRATGERGISYSEERRKFIVQVTRQNQAYWLGQYDTLEDATVGRDKGLVDLPPMKERARVQCDSDQAQHVAAKIRRLFTSGWSLSDIATEAGVGRERLVWVMDSTPGKHVMESTLNNLDAELDRILDGFQVGGDDTEKLERHKASLGAYMSRRHRRIARQTAQQNLRRVNA